MAQYTVARVATALSTTTDFMTLVAPANRRVKINYIYISGQATASAANEVGIYIASTVGATGSAPIVAQPVDPWSAAAATVINTAWTTQPLVANPPIIRAGVNANGGTFVWQALKGQEIILQNAGNVSIRSITGTSLVTVTVGFEE